MDWCIRQTKPLDREHFIDFLGTYLGSVPALTRYQWLYQDNPHGKALTWLAVNNETNAIIGCTSHFPREMLFKGSIILGCVGGDTFVDPKFRRRGIAKELHRASLRGMRDAGIKFQYGFPNRPNFLAHLKAGSTHPGNFKSMLFPLSAEPVFKKFGIGENFSRRFFKLANICLSLYINLKLKKVNSSSVKLKEISEFDDRFDKFIKDVSPSFDICVKRDSKYLNWRYFMNPMKAQKILIYEDKGILNGFVAILYSMKTCYLFDFFVRPESELIDNLISAIIRQAISDGSTLIQSKINPVGPYAKSFRRFGFKLGFGTSEYPLNILVAQDDRDIEYIKNLEKWYLTYGDLDLQSIGAS